MLLELIRKEDLVKIYRANREHFKGGKNHHVEAARKKLNALRLGPDIERDLSNVLELISDLEVAQKMEMPESQKFKVLGVLMAHEKRVHVSIASYNRENFNFTIKKVKEEWDATSRWQQQRIPPQRAEFVLTLKQMNVPGKDVRIFTS